MADHTFRVFTLPSRTATMASKGSIIQVIGSTFDAQFPEEDLPDIYNAVKCRIDVKGDYELFPVTPGYPTVFINTEPVESLV